MDEYDAGIELKGAEIKSIRAGKVSFLDSYISVTSGQAWLLHLHIAPYDKSSNIIQDPQRKRRLLLTKKEINKLKKKTEEQGLTIIPKSIFINQKGLCKIKISLAKGKKNYDKRESIKRKEENLYLARKSKVMN